MSKGIVAAGNRHTAEAAAEILHDGGNAFDAAIAALFTSFATEPVLSSPGGGGFLLAKVRSQPPTILDFFSQTPGRQASSQQLDFHPTTARFSTADQEFHIGLGSAAVPGMVAGIFEAHRKFATLPLSRLAEAASQLARDGHPLDPLQAEIFKVVKPILLATDGSRAVFESRQMPGEPIQALETFRAPQLGDFLTELVKEGERFFYRGDIAGQIAELCRNGGLLTPSDFANYKTVTRIPTALTFRDVDVFTNPPPSSGGMLIAFSLKLVEKLFQGEMPAQNADWYRHLAHVMHETNVARRQTGFAETPNDETASALSQGVTIDRSLDEIASRAQKTGGTTHISVADGQGNLAAVTVSNGEGCGHLVPDAGFMLNNMLGEEDINPRGFFQWQPDTRITSMMSPSYLSWPNGRQMVLGSGGSNRIRTALVQTICNTVLLKMSCDDAVSAPRLHYENGSLNLEAGFSDEALTVLTGEFPDHKTWPGQDFFFGGVHIAEAANGNLSGAADQRRGGYTLRV